MQWCNDDIRVWKIDHEVTIDTLTNYEGQFFQLYMSYVSEGVDLPWYHAKLFQTECVWLRVVKKRSTKEISFDYKLYQDEFFGAIDDVEAGRPIVRQQYESMVITPESLAPLDELIKLGWVELGERK